MEGFPAIREDIDVAGAGIALFVVPELESLLDREALLRGETEPPYWAYLWTGARVLARYLNAWMPLAGLQVLEIGCGLGLPGVVAARAGARVTFVDAAMPALAFVRASLDANGSDGRVLHMDYRALANEERFDLILAAEVAYDRDGFDELASFVARHLRTGGQVLMADGFRTDTRPLYRALARAHLATAAVDCRVVEEGRAAPIRLLLARHAAR